MRVSFTAIGLALLEATIVKATIEYSLVPQTDKPFTISTKAPNQVDDLTLYLQAPPDGHGYTLTPVNMTAWEVTINSHSQKNKRDNANSLLRSKRDPEAASALEKRWYDGCVFCQKWGFHLLRKLLLRLLIYLNLVAILVSKEGMQYYVATRYAALVGLRLHV